MSSLIDMAALSAGGIGVMYAWLTSVQGASTRRVMFCVAWLLLLGSLLNITLRQASADRLMRENQTLIQKLLERPE